ncbi:MAG: FAD-binding oxidoreductase [Planctomycetes bacterium]|nr:FAD-binding oxidoreductase [Planctomycetota bacterium]
MSTRHPSYWEADMTPAPPSGELAKQVDVLIVGAGFMGRWLAYFLRGRDVQVVERDGFGYGASSRNAGFLTCGQISEMLADVETAGFDRVIGTFLERRQGLAIARREFPDLEVDPCGSVDYDDVTDAGRDLMGQLNAAADERVYTLRPATLGGREREAYFNTPDGGVHPVKLMQRLQQAAEGVRFAFGVKANSVARGEAELEVAGTTVRMRYNRAFLCTNAFATELFSSSEVVPGRGQVIVTSPVETATTRALGYINHGYDYFRFVDGRLLIGGGRNRFPGETGTSELRPTVHVREWLEQQAAAVLGHSDWKTEYHWAGVMGFPGGGHLGGSPRRKIDAQTEVVAGFGGMGVALTPLYAQRIAAEM